MTFKVKQHLNINHMIQYCISLINMYSHLDCEFSDDKYVFMSKPVRSNRNHLLSFLLNQSGIDHGVRLQHITQRQYLITVIG